MTQPRSPQRSGARKAKKASARRAKKARAPARRSKARASARPAKAPVRRRTKAPAKPSARWSHHVMETSDALDLEPNVFARGTPRQIALSLKRSAEHSRRRKATPFRSAMSMLNFYINRGGDNLSSTRRRALERAKDELRELFGR